jgi:hypothetical protein
MASKNPSLQQDPNIAVVERRRALEAVLNSRTFARSDRLKRLLQFIAEAEIEGRGNELNEYTIGVEALDRPEGYSTSEDSSVRSRIYELRQKLDRFYSAEAPSADVRIELIRGSHGVRFVRSRPPIAAQWTRDRRILKILGVGILGGALITFAVLSLGLRWRPVQNQPDWTPELEAVWAPLLDRDTPVLISFETRLFVTLADGIIARDATVNAMGQVDSSQPLKKMQRLFDSPQLLENRFYTDFGSTQAVFMIARRLSVRKPRLSLTLSVDLTWNDIRNNHLILLGKANTDPQVRHFLAGSEFVEEGRQVRVVHPRPGEPSEYVLEPDSRVSPNWVDKYAVITMVPGPDPAKRVLILTATGSELPWAVASYLTSPASAKNLVDHLRLPSGRLPDFYQVVVRAQFKGRQPTKIEYVTHRVLSPSPAGK